MKLFIILFLSIAEFCLIWNINTEVIISSQYLLFIFLPSLKQKAACILVAASEYELMNI